MAEEKKAGIFKTALGGFTGLCAGAFAMYFNSAFDKIVKPAKPVANFAVANTDGLTVTFDNRSVGSSGWWDFGDGTPLEPFDADKPTLAHTFPKTGNFNTKLTVRNFMMEENDRSVPVDLSAPPSTLPPTVTGLTVIPIREQVPATYRITGTVANADELVWKLGEKAEHIAAVAGPFEKFVTFDQPGQYPIAVAALSKTKKDPQFLVQQVSVAASATATYEARLTVTDAVTKTETATRTERVLAPVQEKGTATKGFDKVIAAKYGTVITAAAADAKAMPAVVKNLKVEVAADRKSARVTGEWGGDHNAVVKAAGGGDVAVPVTVIEERTTALAPTKNSMSGVADATGQILIPLPPAALATARVTRKIEVDVGITQPAKPRASLAKGTLDANGTWTAPATYAGKPFTVSAVVVNGAVRVTFAGGK